MPTVLVVDDEQSILDIVSAILNRNGFKPVTARTSDAAIQAIQAGGVDVALLDVVMPGRGGLDLLMQIRESRQSLPIIIMSGKVRTDLTAFTQLTAQFGAKAILTKPFTPDELIDALNSVLVPVPRA